MHKKFFFWKKGNTFHTSMDVWKVIEKKNKFWKHCFKWGVLISKCMLLYQNECIYIKMHANCIDRSQNFHRWECNTCHTSPRSVVSHNIYIKMHVSISKWMYWMHGWVRNARKFFFLKKGMTCHTSPRSVESHWKKK